MSSTISCGGAPHAVRFAVNTNACDIEVLRMNTRTASRQCRLMRLRSTAFGETFFDTTHANLLSACDVIRGKTESEKYRPW